MKLMLMALAVLILAVFLVGCQEQMVANPNETRLKGGANYAIQLDLVSGGNFETLAKPYVVPVASNVRNRLVTDTDTTGWSIRWDLYQKIGKKWAWKNSSLEADPIWQYDAVGEFLIIVTAFDLSGKLQARPSVNLTVN